MLGESAKIGNLNWITGFTDTSGSKHFAEELGRKSILSLGAHSAITHRHLIDCTNAVTIGKFSTFGGWRSQILTHGIDVRSSRQSSAPVAIGEFCFISTSCVMLKGSRLPDYSLLAAGAVMTAAATEKYGIYGGVPAKKISELDPSDLYFHRTDGYVW
jgi:acetyltransferase-like isoleucine patch superfamily enzyme